MAASDDMNYLQKLFASFGAATEGDPLFPCPASPNAPALKPPARRPWIDIRRRLQCGRRLRAIDIAVAVPCVPHHQAVRPA